jgi:hypothetical protein
MLRDNGLSIALFALFALSLAGQAVSGFRSLNETRRDHRVAALRFGEYLGGGEFLEATMENWESEFLQMAVYVIFTVFLYQRGSAESKKIDEIEAVDRDPRSARSRPDAPGPVRRGGVCLVLYENSLSLVFLALFLLTWALHAVGGVNAQNADLRAHGLAPIGLRDYLGGSQFWFESLQNWQSEFLSLFAMAVLSIFLRQRGSPESKPVDAPHSATGGD